MSDVTGASMDRQQTINSFTGSGVALGLVFLLGAAIGILLTRPVPDANMNVLLVLLGALATNFTNMVQFFFGNSAGNRQKDATISTLTTTAAAQAASNPSPGAVVATVQTPTATVPLHAGQTATVKADPPKTVAPQPPVQPPKV